MTISLDTLKEAVEVKEQIAKLEARLEKMLGGSSRGREVPSPLTQAVRKGRKKMSAAARAKIGEAQRARWAKAKGTALEATKPLEKKRKLFRYGKS